MLPSRRAFLGHSLVVLCPFAAHADDLSDGRFRDEVAGMLRSLYPGAKVSVDDDPGSVRIEAFVLNITNLHGDLREAKGDERRRRILAFLKGAMPGGPFPKAARTERRESFESARARLRIQLVPPEYIEQAPDIVSRPFSTRLRIAYALDEANRYQIVTAPMLAGWGVDAEALDLPARQNAEADARRVSIEVSPTGARGRFATSATEDGYAASRMLLPEFMDRVRRSLGTAEAVAAAPRREIVIAWTPDSAQKIQLAKLTRLYFREGPYSRSDELFFSSRLGLRPLTPAELVEHGR